VDAANLPAQCTGATLGFETGITRIYLEGSEKSAAVCLSRALPRLVREMAVTLTATLCGKKPKISGARQTSDASFGSMSGVKSGTLRVLVYGCISQKDAIANLLAKEDTFLQHPSEKELERGAKYLNPQYLLPPGQEDMPPFEKLSISTCCIGGAASSRDLLRNYEKGRILKIFDAANTSGGHIATIEPSPRLVTQLKRYRLVHLI
jgi:SWI/SNF-related matrix-associated actin-dependent regulator of chromatin subfamily A3